MQPRRMLRWLYLGRLTLAAGIFGGALLVWPRTTPETTLGATLALLLALGATLGGVWHTTVRSREPGRTFLYGQVLLDALLVTVVIHITGGARSEFPPLYILVIATGALLLPLPGGVLIGAIASALYMADVAWLEPASASGTAVVQVLLFTVMALVTGALGDRLRRTRTALTSLSSELEQLRLDTGELLQAIDTGLVTVDGTGRLVYLNEAGERLLGVQERVWQGLDVTEELDRRVPGLGGLISRTLASREGVERYEIRLPASAGARILGARTTLLEREGGPPWVTAVFQDITEGKKLEALERRADRLQAVASLAASLAHEIKNPLASIRSAAEQLAASRVEAGDREVLGSLVLGETDRLSRLLTEFMEFSRVEVKRRDRVELGAVAAQAVELVGRHPDACGARIVFHPPADAVLVEGDADLLHRALFNLILNGAQHAGQGGAVEIELGPVAEGELPAGVRLQAPVRVAVRDSGPGIPADALPRVFDPFFTTRRGGTGLGLAMVHRAVEAHRGAIVVDGGEREGGEGNGGGSPGGANGYAGGRNGHGACGGTGASFFVYLPSRVE